MSSSDLLNLEAGPREPKNRLHFYKDNAKKLQNEQQFEEVDFDSDDHYGIQSMLNNFNQINYKEVRFQKTMHRYYKLKESIIELYVDLKYRFKTNCESVLQDVINEDKAKCGKISAQEIVSYIRQTLDMILQQKDEEIMQGVYEEHKRQEQRKIENIKNFVEFRCKDRDEREKYATEIIQKQRKRKQEMKMKIDTLRIATQQFQEYK